MVEVDFSGNFWNEENTKNGDIGVIVGEGAMESKTNPNTNEQFEMLNLPVEVDGKQRSWTPSNACGKELTNAWGKDTKKWVGKKVKAEIVAYTSYGQKKRRVDFLPLEEKV